MRPAVAVCVLVSLACACGDNDTNASLLIVPSGTNGVVQITGPTDFSAVLVASSGDITWKVNGAGTLSTPTGLHTIFAPPTGTSTATLTATTSDGLSASVQVESGPAVLTPATIPGLSGPVTVQYDAQDIPHIQCAATIDCLAVQGFLQARDRFFPMDFLRHVARANLAELIGIAGLSQDVQLRTLFTTRAGHRLEADLASVMDASTKQLVQAFAGGVNAYLTQVRAGKAQLPGEYAQLPFPITGADVADWTVEDTMALARLQQFQLSETIEQESAFGQFAAVYGQGPLKDLAKINAWIRAAAPVTEQAHTLSPTASTIAPKSAAMRLPKKDATAWRTALAATRETAATLTRQLRPPNTTVGSNNWAVAAAKSGTGAAMVANDPHLSLQYPPLFYLSTMTSTNAADNLDLTGGSFPGIPGALVGRGAHVGWGVTVVGYDVTDLYLEQFLPQASCPNAAPCVLFKGAPTSTLPVPQTYKIRTAAGLVDANTLPAAQRPPPVVLIIPHHGPVIQAPDAGGKAVSVRWTGHESNTQDVKAILGLNTAANVDAAIAALKFFATGAQNFVLADDAGHIAYDPHALVPVRQFADIAIKGAAVIPPWFPLPGDGTAEWGDGTSNCASATATPVPDTCWIADAALPQGKDPAKGYFFTANADPTATGVSDDNNPLGHPPYLSFDWDDSTGFRATRIEQMIEEAIASHGKVTLDDMEAIQADHVSRPGKVFTDIVAALPASGNDPADFIAARAMFAGWATNGWNCPSALAGTDPVASPIVTEIDTTTLQDSAACFLFHQFLRILIANVFADDLAVANQNVNGLQALKGIIFMLGRPDGPETTFCNDVNRSGVVVATHTCASHVVRALIAANASLTAQLGPPSNWIWGRVHTIHPVSLLQLVTTDFAPGPYARPGGAFTVDVGSPSLSGTGLDFAYAAGGNVRHISVMDPAAPKVRMQLPGPERDTPTLFVGPDLLGQWVQNKYFDFAHGDQIRAAAVSTQSFKAP